jgi:hypothetical protein
MGLLVSCTEFDFWLKAFKSFRIADFFRSFPNVQIRIVVSRPSTLRQQMTPVTVTFRLVTGWMVDSRQKSYTAAVAVCIEVAMVQRVAGIQHGLKADPTYARLNFALWTTTLLLFVSAVGFVSLAVERYFSVIGKTQEYGVLRVLGASLSYIWLIELIETLAICVPGTAVGIALTFLIRLGVNLTLREFLRLDFVITDCAIALGIVVIGSVLGSGIGMMKALRDGMVQALSYEK